MGAALQPESPRASRRRHPQFLGRVGGFRLKLFCFFSLEQICEPRLVGGVFLCGTSRSTPVPPPRRPSVYVSNGKKPYDDTTSFLTQIKPSTAPSALNQPLAS